MFKPVRKKINEIDHSAAEALLQSNRRGSGSCTHRPSHQGSWKCPKSVTQPQGGSCRRQVR